MKAISETELALGLPILLRRIGPSAGPLASVARWKHGDCRVETNAADAVRVCLSLRGGHSVRHGRDQTATRIVGGSVRILAADRYSDIQITGQADVIQIFIDPEYLNEHAGSHVICDPSVGFTDSELQSAALGVFMAARGSYPDDVLQMEVAFWRIVELLATRYSRGAIKTLRGGLAPGSLRRIEQLIAERLEDNNMQPLSIDEIARAARMSVSHFIRAFRQSTGATPHQHVLTRRIEKAMGLLARPDSSVAEIADSTGYASPAHFVASFRQRLGMTPGTYRQAVLN